MQVVEIYKPGVLFIGQKPAQTEQNVASDYLLISLIRIIIRFVNTHTHARACTHARARTTPYIHTHYDLKLWN